MFEIERPELENNQSTAVNNRGNDQIDIIIRFCQKRIESQNTNSRFEPLDDSINEIAKKYQPNPRIASLKNQKLNVKDDSNTDDRMDTNDIDKDNDNNKQSAGNVVEGLVLIFNEDAYSEVLKTKRINFINPLKRTHTFNLNWLYSTFDQTVLRQNRREERTVKNKRDVCSVEKDIYDDYLTNLKVLPTLVPSSPIVTLLARITPQRFYRTSSSSLSLLKTLYRIYDGSEDKQTIDSNDARTLKPDYIFKVPDWVSERTRNNMIQHMDSVINNYVLNIFHAMKAFLYAFDIWHIQDDDKNADGKPVNILTKDDIDKLFKMDQDKTFLKTVGAIMYTFIIDVINIHECACINLYVFSPSSDISEEGKQIRSKFCDWSNKQCIRECWNDFLTPNLLDPLFTPQSVQKHEWIDQKVLYDKWDDVSYCKFHFKEYETRIKLIEDMFSKIIDTSVNTNVELNLSNSETRFAKLNYFIGKTIKSDVDAIKLLQQDYCDHLRYSIKEYNISKEFEGLKMDSNENNNTNNNNVNDDILKIETTSFNHEQEIEVINIEINDTDDTDMKDLSNHLINQLPSSLQQEPSSTEKSSCEHSIYTLLYDFKATQDLIYCLYTLHESDIRKEMFVF